MDIISKKAIKIILISVKTKSLNQQFKIFTFVNKIWENLKQKYKKNKSLWYLTLLEFD